MSKPDFKLLPDAAAEQTLCDFKVLRETIDAPDQEHADIIAAAFTQAVALNRQTELLRQWQPEGNSDYQIRELIKTRTDLKRLAIAAKEFLDAGNDNHFQADTLNDLLNKIKNNYE